jgi:beta-barrel assembly-enhancing protease
MGNGLARKFGSAVIVLAVWLGATISLPASLLAQTTSGTTAQDTKKDKKEKKTDAAAADSAKQAQAGKSGLATNEDPSMIGKRNINGGSDKLFGWLGGSKDKEIALGRQLATEFEQQAKLVDDPVITEYVNRVGQNIVLHSDAKVPFTIKVVDTDEVNAFALPGGFFYVNKGLILAADNESELAGVMAHEIGHVAARHAMENQGKMQALNYGMIAGIIFGGGILGSVLQNGGSLGQALAFFKFSRGAEEEADRLGVQYLYAAGYDPTGMAAMFEKIASLNKKKPGTLSKLFASHPQSIERRDTSLALVARFPEHDEYVISTSEFQKVKARLLRQSNAKAMTTLDTDDNDQGKPTLKRRQPDGDNTTTTTTTDDKDTKSTKDDGPPILKRRGDEPQVNPSPTPSPE